MSWGKFIATAGLFGAYVILVKYRCNNCTYYCGT